MHAILEHDASTFDLFTAKDTVLFVNGALKVFFLTIQYHKYEREGSLSTVVLCVWNGDAKLHFSKYIVFVRTYNCIGSIRDDLLPRLFPSGK